MPTQSHSSYQEFYFFFFFFFFSLATWAALCCRTSSVRLARIHLSAAGGRPGACPFFWSMSLVALLESSACGRVVMRKLVTHLSTSTQGSQQTQKPVGCCPTSARPTFRKH